VGVSAIALILAVWIMLVFDKLMWFDVVEGGCISSDSLGVVVGIGVLSPSPWGVNAGWRSFPGQHLLA